MTTQKVAPAVAENGNLSKTFIFIFAACQFVCPLIFFTDVTRNPYYTQIALLNILLAAGAAIWVLRQLKQKAWVWKKAAPDIAWLAWLAVCMLSWGRAYLGHAPFFKPAVAAEGTRVWVFTVVNCFFAYWLAKSVPAAGKTFLRPIKYPLLLIFWGILWAAFPQLRSEPEGWGMLPRIFDLYGAAVWALGIWLAWKAARGGTQEDFLHLAFAAGGICSAYGILQSFGFEWIWPKLLNPYGSRSVSTFGNPNFLSSYLVMLLPFSLVYYLRQASAAKRVFYGGLFLVYEGALLATLTRSSWLGAAAALGALLLVSDFRKLLLLNKKPLFALLAPAVFLAAFWPSSSVGSYHPTVAQRISELRQMKTGLSSVGPAEEAYGPWHQRLLIWSGCSLMGLENPVLGKGWGLLELFYPYYQGPLLVAYDGLRSLRTHANNAHNEIIEVWSQTGILGLGAYIWIFALFFTALRKHCQSADSDEKLFAACGGAAVAGMLADNMLNVSLHFTMPAFLFWWIFGTAASRAARFQNAESPWRSAALARAMAVSALIALAGTAVFWHAQWMREARYFQGFKLLRKNETRLAVETLEKAHWWYPREVNTNYELANAYIQAGDFPRAVWAYKEALRSNCGYDEIFFNLAVALDRKLGKKEEAMSALKTSLWINPLNLQGYSVLADFALSSPERRRLAAEAIPVLETGAKVFGGSGNFFNTLGYFYVVIKDDGKARRAFIEGLKVEPFNEMLEANLLKADLSLAITRDDFLESLKPLRAASAKIASGEKSDGFLRETLSRSASDSNPHWKILLAKIYYARGDFETAKAQLYSALASGGAAQPARLGLAALCERAGDAAAARRWLERALAENPVFEPAKNRLKLPGSGPADWWLKTE